MLAKGSVSKFIVWYFKDLIVEEAEAAGDLWSGIMPLHKGNIWKNTAPLFGFKSLLRELFLSWLGYTDHQWYKRLHKIAGNIWWPLGPVQ